jgi:hypothetical protein
MTIRTCSTCDADKDLTEFARRGLGHAYSCKECSRKSVKKARVEAPRPNSPAIHMIVPSLGYLKSNCEVVSYRATQVLGDSTPGELFQVTRGIATVFNTPDRLQYLDPNVEEQILNLMASLQKLLGSVRTQAAVTSQQATNK